MKSKLLVTLFALLTGTTVWADVEINGTSFPDENFRKYLLRQVYGADSLLTEEEIASVTYIDVQKYQIQSLKGIERFTALTFLNCYDNRLTTLDVSRNTSLIHLECNYNQLTSLYVSGCTAMSYLRCSENQLAALDVSRNLELTELICNGNQLTSLNVSNNTKLERLECNNNLLTAIDVSKNAALIALACGANLLTSLDVSHNQKLEGLQCNNNQLTVLDVSNHTRLGSLQCLWNQLIALNASGCTALYSLQCYDNKLTTLNIEGCCSLRSWLDCYKNQLKGAAMDAFVENLPVIEGHFEMMKVIYNEDEHNVMTTAQVNAARAKGWIPLSYTGISVWGYTTWEEYAGSETEGTAGDLNGDSKVDIADAVSILNLMAEDCDEPTADLNARWTLLTLSAY